MARIGFRKAFTLIELLVVVAIIALLISILLPALSSAREQGKRAYCLANLRSIAQGSAAYSTEEYREHAIPIHQQMVSTHIADGLVNDANYWPIRTAMPYGYGGRTPQVQCPGVSTGPAWTDDYGRWAGKTRPLNRYVYNSTEISDYKKMPMYRCPSDVGLPASPFVIEYPTQARDIPCYDMMGNSYRINGGGMFLANDYSAVSIGPLGHRASTLKNTARQVAFMEPLFYSMTFEAIYQGIPDNLLLRGWHKKVMTGNVGYVDGSGRATRVHNLEPWLDATLRGMACDPSITSSNASNWLRRGKTWQMECYPTPAAILPKYRDNGTPSSTDDMIYRVFATINNPGWPFVAMQNNTQ